MAIECYRVGPREAGSRLDLFLKAHGPAVSRKQAKRLLDAGLVRVNVAESATDSDAERYFLKVIYEDDYLIVVEKDAGIPCEDSPQALKPSLVQIINAYLRKNAPPESRPYLGLIHRLDQETSGLSQILAKTTGTEREQGLIKTGLEKELKKGGAKVRITEPRQGKPAQTHFHVLERYRNATLLEVIPRTGRTHQIRVHLAHIGHPLIGDKLYGDGAGFRFKRQALHATVLGFIHPISGKKLKFQSPLPKDMRKLVDKLRLKS